MAPSGLGDRRLVARAGLALVVANARYWISVAPIARRELKRWELRALTIDDPELRALALSKLRTEGFHAEAAAMLATLARRAHRQNVVEAIVALELLFDYLDGLTERCSRDPLGEGQRLFRVLTDAVIVPGVDPGKNLELPPRSDDGYLELLSRTVSCALGRLPAAAAISEVAQRIASRSGGAQTRMHAVSRLGTTQVEEWAREEAGGTGLPWRDTLASAASSVLVLHALIAAAADPCTTPESAAEIAAAYLPTCVVLTLLDGLVDHDEDTQAGEVSPEAEIGDEYGIAPTSGGIVSPGYLDLYDDRTELPDVLGNAARRAAVMVRALPNSAHHTMILVGVAAYYGSAPGAEGELAQPVITRLRRELAPLVYPTLAIMRSWRRLKAANAFIRGERRR